MDAYKDQAVRLLQDLHDAGRPHLDKLIDQFWALDNVQLKITPFTMTVATLLVTFWTVAFYIHLKGSSDISRKSTNVATGSNIKHNSDAPPLPPPTEIVSLRVYPIKSCRGFEVTSTRLRTTGLTLDRNWMFISKSDNQFLTIRSDPTMTLIDTKLILSPDAPTDSPPLPEHHLLQISIHNQPDATVTIPAYPTRTWLETNTTLTTVTIWESPTDAWQYSDTINSIFNSHFHQPVALVYKGPSIRPVAVNGRPELYGKTVPHHFADVMSLLVASEASLSDLNTRLGYADDSAHKLTIERFRPNIIVKGTVPWEEDAWKRVRITTRLDSQHAVYKVDLDAVARCARCQVPNVDPDTAEKDKHQPWDVMMKFRRVDQGGVAKWKPCFGMLCIPRNEGVLEVGAKVEVLETTAKHSYNAAAFDDL